MNLETKITIYKFTPQLFTLTPVESIAADCIVHPSRPYSPLAETVADDCKKRLNYMEETAYTTTLFRFYLFQIIRRSHTEFIFKTLTKIDRTVNSHLERNF